MNKITCICLGVRDMKKAIHFYRDELGFQSSETANEPQVIFFDTPGTKFELYPLEALAQEVGDHPSTTANTNFNGITLAYNVSEKEDVRRVIELVKKAGGSIVLEPQDVFWGGYHAYFKDLDGYYWEVTWGADFRYDEQGMLIL